MQNTADKPEKSTPKQSKYPRGWKGIWMPAELWTAEELSVNEKWLLAEIDSLDSGEGCYASNEHLRKMLNVSNGVLYNCLTKLKEMGLIKQVGWRNRVKVWKADFSRFWRSSSPNTGEVPLQILETERKKREIVDEKKDIAPTEPSSETAIKELVPHQMIMKAWNDGFLAKYGQKPQINGRTGKQVKDLLKNYEQLVVIECINLYLEKDDLWFNKRGLRDFGQLVYHFNELLSIRGKQEDPERQRLHEKYQKWFNRQYKKQQQGEVLHES